MINVFVGFDQREAIAYHTFCQSVIEKASEPVSFTPLALNTLAGYTETHTDGSNQFIYSRFLTPFLRGFEGWALFADGDMICRDDLAKLWALRDESKAVLVAKHDYKTRAHEKYLGNKNQDYPRKNWSSVILWNCGHERNRCLDPNYVMNHPGSHLHRFAWLSDDLIGDIPKEWNWLTTEYPDNYEAKLLHYTLGTPCFKDYADSEMAELWHDACKRANQGIGA
jgi:lipopolysaccharide biosynthesis glycosyltransferase